MIAFVDGKPTVTPSNGHFILSFGSGGAEVKVMVTRNTLVLLGRAALEESHQAFEDDAEIVPFQLRARP